MSDQSDNKPRIFLCHAKEDKPQVAELYHKLKEAGYHPWLDKYDLLPGQDWWVEIERIISDLDNLVVVCLSSKSTAKPGVVQKEIKRALDVLDQMPEDKIYLIPARLEPCRPPRRLSHLQWVDIFEPGGFENLKRALEREIGKRQVAAERKPFEPELILIPAGKFLMGSDPKKDESAHDDEQPQHSLYLPDYYIAKTPVTNVQYAAFVQETEARQPERWKNKQPPRGKQDHPVVDVSWLDAVAYCHWLSNATGKNYRLPTEAEWEKAARGTDGWIYPWGNQWDEKLCNSVEGGIGDTTPVGAYPDGASPYGVLDMAGNVWEWCLTQWGKAYPYDVGEDKWSEYYLLGGGGRLLRGGSWRHDQYHARCANRSRNFPHGSLDSLLRLNLSNGFRIMVSPISLPSAR